MDGSSLIRAGCYLCERPRKSVDCPHRFEPVATSTQSQHKHGGFIVSVRRNLSSGIIASVGSGSILTANVTIQRHHQFRVGDSGAIKDMVHDPSGLKTTRKHLQGSDWRVSTGLICR